MMIRTFAVAALAGFAFAGAAAAQSPDPTAAPAQVTPPPPAFVTQCPGQLPAVPALPDGATANARAMEGGNATIQAWSVEYLAIMNCRVAEVNALEAQLAELLARRNAAKNLYDADAAAYRAGGASWEAEVAEFNARTPQRGGRDRRSTGGQ